MNLREREKKDIGNEQPVLEGHALASAEKNCFNYLSLINKKNSFLLRVYERALLVRRGTGATKTAVPQVST